MTKRWLAVIAIGLAFVSVGESRALDFPATCRGATAVVTDISGLNSRVAKMTAKHTLPDAITYCEYQGRTREVPGGDTACVAKFMRQRRDTLNQAQADCQAGTLTTVAKGLPTQEFPKSTWISTYKFPIFPSCGGDNAQAVAIFKILCPSYRAQIEEGGQ